MDFTNFENLPDEKRRVILDAAFMTFGQHGYKKASIAQIAQQADISKSAMFYYFNTKMDLFFYLNDFVHQVLFSEMEEGNEDFFESWKIAMRARHRIAKVYSGFYSFLRLISRQDAFDQFPELAERLERNTALSFDKLFRHVDWSRLREGCSRELVMKIMGYVSEGIMNDFIADSSEDSILVKEDQYYTVLKQAFYK